MNLVTSSRARAETADEAVEGIRSGMRVFLSGNCGMPRSLVDALIRRAPRLQNVELVQALAIGPAPYTDPGMAGHLRLNTLFISHSVRSAVAEAVQISRPVFCPRSPILRRLVLAASAGKV